MEQSAPDMARSLLRLGDADGASRIAEASLRELGDQANTNEAWRFRCIRAQALEAQGHVEAALGYLESQARPLDEDIESNVVLKMYCGAYSGFLGRYEPAHHLLSEADAIAREAGLVETQADVYLSWAFIFFRQKDYASSDRLFRAALELSGKVGGWYLRGHSLWGIGKNLMIQEQYEEAMPWLNESLEIFENASTRLSIAMVWSELAVCYLGLGDDERAMDLLRKAEQVNYEAGVIHNYQVVLANIGNVYLHRRDYFAALSYYRRALAFAREIKDPVSIKKWTRNINLAYARIRLAVDQASPQVAKSETTKSPF